jgi:hypothetical protein
MALKHLYALWDTVGRCICAGCRTQTVRYPLTFEVDRRLDLQEIAALYEASLIPGSVAYDACITDVGLGPGHTTFTVEASYLVTPAEGRLLNLPEDVEDCGEVCHHCHGWRTGDELLDSLLTNAPDIL